MLIVPSTITTPSTITIRFKSPALSFDLTTVTGVTLGVLRRDGTQTTWTMTMLSATSSELVAQYQFQGGEITGTGIYMLAPALTVSGGTISAETVSMFVASPFSTMARVEDDSNLIVTAPVSANPPSSTWFSVAGTLAASPTAPWLAVDLRAQASSVTLWTPNDGDWVVLTDVYQPGTFALTLHANATNGGQLPVGNGTYSSSITPSSGFQLRLKYMKSAGLWLRW